MNRSESHECWDWIGCYIVSPKDAPPKPYCGSVLAWGYFRDCWFIITIINHISGRFCMWMRWWHTFIRLKRFCRRGERRLIWISLSFFRFYLWHWRSHIIFSHDWIWLLRRRRWNRVLRWFKSGFGHRTRQWKGKWDYGTDADYIASHPLARSFWSSAPSRSTNFFQDQCAGLWFSAIDAALPITSARSLSTLGFVTRGSQFSCVFALHPRRMLPMETSRCRSLTFGRCITLEGTRSGSYRELCVSWNCASVGSGCQIRTNFSVWFFFYWTCTGTKIRLFQLCMVKIKMPKSKNKIDELFISGDLK